MADSTLDQVEALVRDARATLAALTRDDLRATDATGELGILVGALERVVGKLEERLAVLGGATQGSDPPAASQQRRAEPKASRATRGV